MSRSKYSRPTMSLSQIGLEEGRAMPLYMRGNPRERKSNLGEFSKNCDENLGANLVPNRIAPNPFCDAGNHGGSKAR
jgi:hypothetical protein